MSSTRTLRMYDAGLKSIHMFLGTAQLLCSLDDVERSPLKLVSHCNTSYTVATYTSSWVTLLNFKLVEVRGVYIFLLEKWVSIAAMCLLHYFCSFVLSDFWVKWLLYLTCLCVLVSILGVVSYKFCWQFVNYTHVRTIFRKSGTTLCSLTQSYRIFWCLPIKSTHNW